MFKRSELVLLCLFGLVVGHARAEPLALDFVLAAATPGQNTVPITVTVSVDTGFPFGTLTDSDTASSPVSGNARVDLDLGFDQAGQVAALNTLAFTGGQVRFDNPLAFNLSYALGLATVQINASNLAGQLQSPAGPAPIVGNSVDLSAHQIQINQGTLVAAGSGFADGISQSVDFAAVPLAAPLSGSATLVVVLDQAIDGLGYYTATLNAPFAFNQSVALEGEGIAASVSTSANLLATASFTRAIYAPGDTDGDGDIDDTDLGSSFSNYTGPSGTGKAPAQGDTDLDGDVDDTDLGTLFSTYTGPLAPPAVPEPGTLALFALGLAGMGRRRR